MAALLQWQITTTGNLGTLRRVSIIVLLEGCILTLETDREIAHITLPIKAAIDCQVNLPRSMYALPFNGEPNALQMLVFWIQSARGLTKVPLVWGLTGKTTYLFIHNCYLRLAELVLGATLFSKSDADHPSSSCLHVFYCQHDPLLWVLMILGTIQTEPISSEHCVDNY